MMKRFLLTATLMLATTVPALAGVSITVGEPGFYGSLDIGNFPRPMLVSPEPVIIQPVPTVVYEPIYMRVPPGQIKNWGRYCGSYNACGRPVYFVKDSWYEDVYVPHYREVHWKKDKHHHKHEGHGHGHGHGHD